MCAYLKGRMSFSSSNVQLAGFYADGTQNILTTDVYANGVMQAEVWVSINYNGSTSGIESNINNYVYNNTAIYQLSGSSKSKVNWTKSATSNSFLHDIKRGGVQSQTTTSDYRVPIYLTVPKGIGGLYKWIAELGGVQTSSSSPIEVTVTTIAPSVDDVEIGDVVTVNQSVLRSVRYTHATLPGNHLLKQWRYEGIWLNQLDYGNCWIVMVRDGYSCGALTYGKDKIELAVCTWTYHMDRGEGEVRNVQNSNGLSAGETQFTTTPWDWDDASEIASSYVQQSCTNGNLPIVGIVPCANEYSFHLWSNSSSGRSNFTYNPVAQDNFGNWIKLIMNWNDTSKGSDRSRDWVITDVQLAN